MEENDNSTVSERRWLNQDVEELGSEVPKSHALLASTHSPSFFPFHVPDIFMSCIPELHCYVCPSFLTVQRFGVL